MNETILEKSLAKGLLAGLIAGLIATAAKSAAEKLYPPRVHGEPDPPEVLADELAGHPLEPANKARASQAIHWGFGALAGAAYGALAEFYPAAAAGDGKAFGLALMTLTHETALPAVGLSEDAEGQSSREQTSEAATHLVFGMVAEQVRSFVRGLL